MSQKNDLKPDDIVTKKKNVVCRFLDERAILLAPGYHHPFRLNEMGTRIWQLMDHHSRVDDLIDSVYGFYQVDRDEVVPDIISFLSKLMEKKLIK
ncbi:MAG: PqqD family protein [Deltaproteobacteria bacterium]|nr:PqqD family protein [Deltaproteobacteria bacterium]MBW2117685.1 PqqD family protein [Deltaproteobacteria bacterium]MBW2344828.1 PqqD family protein [Deltaproteobacteria bacterium]